MARSYKLSRMRRVLSIALLLFSVAGCGGGLHPVQGKVTFEDGTPLTIGMVVFESTDGKTITARGDIQADGTYCLGTKRPGDGVPPGKYRVLIAPREDISAAAPERSLTFDKRYTDFSTSGLEYEVKVGPNEFPIRLKPPSKGRRS